MKPTQESMNYITVNPKIQGGTPTISGTRIPVERVKILYMQGYSFDQIADAYPNLTPKLVKGVIEEVFMLATSQLHGQK